MLAGCVMKLCGCLQPFCLTAVCFKAQHTVVDAILMHAYNLEQSLNVMLREQRTLRREPADFEDCGNLHVCSFLAPSPRVRMANRG